MTLHSDATATVTAGEDFDSAPLSWVMGEIRETLTRSAAALSDALAQEQDGDARSELLRQAKMYLHQAHGALQIVDVDGVAILTETIEDLYDRLASAQLPLTSDTARAIGQAGNALIEYLEELLGGALPQPVRLFPYYQALLGARGAERIHPADLFFPNLAIRPVLPLPDAGAIAPPDYVALRKDFEKGLLPFLKGGPGSTAAGMGAIVGAIERAQTNQQSRGFWWVMHAFAEGVASGQIANELYVKQLFARINLQIRRLSEGSTSITERLLRDALFFIARVEQPAPALQQIRQVYRLDGRVPADFERKRYGQVDSAALATARACLVKAKTLWNRIAGGDHGVADAFEQEMYALSGAGALLNTPSLAKLLRELNGIARAGTSARPGDRLGLEMATSLLFVEHSLAQIGHLDEHFAARADALTARLLSVVAGENVDGGTPWLDDMSRQAQQRQTLVALTGELQSSLRQVEKTLEEYFARPSDKAVLAPVDAALHQVGGALAVLDQDDAVRAIAHIRAALRHFADMDAGPDVVADAPRIQQIARNIGALGFFIETLQLQVEGKKKRFAFDDATGVFQARLIDRDSPAAIELTPLIVPVAAVSGVATPASLEQGSTVAGRGTGYSEPPPAALQSPEAVVELEPELELKSEPEAKHEAKHEAEAAAGDASNDSAPVSPAAQVADLHTVEQDLLTHQGAAWQMALAVVAAPADTDLQARLRQALQQVRRDASLIDQPDAIERVKSALTLLDAPDFSTSAAAHEALMAATILPVTVAKAVPLTAVDAPSSDEEVDAELLEIFLSEAVEVLGAVRTTLPAARAEPHNQEHLTTLRRAFHTLKGSGRMVGLMAFGDAAWSIEQVMNLRLAESGGGDADLYALLDMALGTLGRWVDDLQERGRSSAAPDALVAAAERVMQGLPFRAEGAASLDPVIEVMLPAAPSFEIPTGQSGEPQELDLSDADMALFGALPAVQAALPDHADLPPMPTPELPQPAQEAGELVAPDAAATPDDGFVLGMLPPPEPAPPVEPELPVEPEPQAVAPGTAGASGGASVIEFPTLQAPEVARNDNVKQIGSLEIGVALYNIYLAETDELVRLLSHDFDEWRHEPERQVNVAAMHAAHSLAGTSATVGFGPLQEIAHALEVVLQQLGRSPVRLLESERDLLDRVLDRVRYMLRLFALGEMADHEPQQVVTLQALQQALTARADTPEQQPVTQEFAAFDPRVVADEPAASPGLVDVVDVADASDASAASDASDVSDVSDVSDASEAIAAAEPGIEADMAPVIAPSMAAAFAGPATGAPEILPLSTVQLKDELDPDLMPVFVEEASDMLPQMGQALRAWQQSPADGSAPQAILRLLHTIKGSARMAGAMRLGQHMHEMESRIEQLMHLHRPSPQMLDDLLARHDHGLQMFDSLQHPQVPDPVGTYAPQPLIATLPDATTVDPLPAEAQPDVGADSAALVAEASAERRELQRQQPDLAQTGSAPVPLVRVRADILDRLVNQAGEVSISRSRLENEVATMRQSLVELTENVARLREQLREVEMQAESQIANQTSQRSSADGQFDPLEFDRFTRLQELTRMMAESVSDVGSVQQTLARSVEDAVADLGTQARLTRELQQDLMRVRMVQFASITERLYRVTRQASKEVDKRVNLDIRGNAVEIDRSVLEKMAGPFEHLLRNAIVHGIESRAGRLAAGKNEVGELLVEVRQEGNEVVIEFSDDGQGLDLERIRSKATQTGLLGNDAALSDAELTDLIFHPGFSTATEVTELAGRGIGMDVVRAEATSLGGRVAIASEAGKGAHFTVHLPLTLAVTQVVLLTTGGKTYAVPSVLVEQVQQLKAQALTAAYNEGAVTWQSQRVPMAYLATLLGESGISAVSQQYSPLMLLKSGNHRIAIHVDEILGNREVVVKNIGPQLSRLTGIAGATVLGSGEIVLILNPVALGQRGLQDQSRALQAGADLDLPVTGAGREFGHDPAAHAVAGLRTQHIVMVVDDSLTVRRVTQRLLSREGYQVVLAKDGVDALEQLQAITPDVMLVDIEMPRMDGFDLTRNIRDDARTRHIPIIMITSRTAAKHRNFAFELGVNEYLGKPYQEELLLASVAGFVRKDAPVA